VFRQQQETDLRNLPVSKVGGGARSVPVAKAAQHLQARLMLTCAAVRSTRRLCLLVRGGSHVYVLRSYAFDAA
jgi:hypothetical protein